MTRRSLPTTSALGLAIGLLALAGCGSSSNSTSSSAPAATSTPPATTSAATTTTTAPAAGASTVPVSANPEGLLKFVPSTLAAKAGKVTFNFHNPASVEHNFTLASSSGSVVGATPTFQGGSKTVAVNLTPGTYKFYCTVPGHRQAGMEGTLVVR